jgi:hypothetical protein
VDHHHAARSSDPFTSHEAKKRRAPDWDKYNGRALRLNYEHRDTGLTNWEAEKLVPPLWLGRCPWKRNGELHTDYDPPLTELVHNEDGTERTRPGPDGDPQEVYRISAAGVAWYNERRP